MSLSSLYTYTRAIVAKFPNAFDIDEILKQGNRLKDTNHYVQRQMPQQVTERKNVVLPAYKSSRQDKSANTRLVNDKLFVNRKYQSQYQAPKLPALNIDEVIDTDLADITLSDDISDAGSVFTSYAAEITDMKSVGTAVNRVLLKPRVSSSTHDLYISLH